jgi:nucleotide-binding universal stress UspA family protein
MGCIVCATRGGEASRRAQERAIELARERGDLLIFFFAVDPAFTAPAQRELAQVVADEWAQLGRRLLSIAQSRAREQGVESEAVMRYGRVWPTLSDFLAEVSATTLVLGTPSANPASDAFSPGEVYAFADQVHATGVEVVTVQ